MYGLKDKEGKASYDGETIDDSKATRVHLVVDGHFRLGLLSVSCRFHRVLGSVLTSWCLFLKGMVRQ